MGIPRFYRWLSERYPLINENITAEQIPDFDNLYLDMNGIIHNCSHNNTGGLCVNDETDVFVEAFKYITRLFHIIRPKKLIYMAIDGCAPRAKMNQQRSRRFRAANDAREAREKAEEMGEVISGSPFDSNCITPGTEFMAKLTTHLQFFIAKKIQEDPLWQGVTVVLSGPETPGEGEHKIMDYIRTMKAQPDYPPNVRHCIYGLDADLMMLALVSHEPHFALLREEVVFGRRTTETVEQRMLISKDRFQLLHVSLLREYLDLEFGPTQNKQLNFEYNLERLIDDFVLFCVLVGNDFVPCLPFAEIGENGLEDFFSVYKAHLAENLDGEPWLTNNCGEVVFEQLAKFLKRYGEIEDGRLQAEVDEAKFILGRRRTVGQADAPAPPNSLPDDLPFDLPPTAEDARVQYYEVKFGMNIETYEGTQAQRKLFQSYLEALQWVLLYYFRGPDAASWGWYYPYYHAPMAYDIALYDKLSRPGITFDVGGPFKPFQQLMAVLPSNSKVFLPECYQWLFESPESPILDFYPKKFQVDMDGVKTPWGGVTLIPWIDVPALLAAMAEAEHRGPALTDAELKRNSFQKAHSFKFDRSCKSLIKSTIPNRFHDLKYCPVRIEEFEHPTFPEGGVQRINELRATVKESGFPTLHVHPLTFKFEGGVKVFQFEARGQSLIIELMPPGPVIPTEDVINELLNATSAQIDYPVVHRGKVVAVHTSSKKYFPGGQSLANNPRDHENAVWNIVQAWRQKGLTLKFAEAAAGDVAAGARKGNKGSDELYKQPLVEVQIAESSWIDNDGRLQMRFKETKELRLLHLVRPEKALPAYRHRRLSERFPVGTPVVCIARDSQVFGQLGSISNSTDDPNTLQASFAQGLSIAQQEALQSAIAEVAQRQQASLEWYNIETVAQMVNLEVKVVRLIFGSVHARCADFIREDIGMNLVAEPKGKNGLGPLCIPCYSMKSPEGWWFSSLAVEALTDYSTNFPGLFEAIKHRRNQSQDLEARFIFTNCLDIDYAARKLVKYVQGCPFKRLRLAPLHHMALTVESIREVTGLIDSAFASISASATKVDHVQGLSNLYKAEDSGSRPPEDLFSEEDLMLGQRGIYIKANGLVPSGTKATIIGVYGVAPNQEFELLLDEDNFGGTDLCGRAPGMRGLKVPASSFMPLYPRLNLYGFVQTENWEAEFVPTAQNQEQVWDEAAWVSPDEVAWWPNQYLETAMDPSWQAPEEPVVEDGWWSNDCTEASATILNMLKVQSQATSATDGQTFMPESYPEPPIPKQWSAYSKTSTQEPKTDSVGRADASKLFGALLASSEAPRSKVVAKTATDRIKSLIQGNPRAATKAKDPVQSSGPLASVVSTSSSSKALLQAAGARAGSLNSSSKPAPTFEDWGKQFDKLLSL